MRYINFKNKKCTQVNKKLHESVESSSVNRNGRSNRLQSHKQNTKAFLKTAPALCVLSFISSRPASLSHSIS